VHNSLLDIIVLTDTILVFSLFWVFFDPFLFVFNYLLLARARFVRALFVSCCFFRVKGEALVGVEGRSPTLAGGQGGAAPLF